MNYQSILLELRKNPPNNLYPIKLYDHNLSGSLDVIIRLCPSKSCLWHQYEWPAPDHHILSIEEIKKDLYILAIPYSSYSSRVKEIIPYSSYSSRVKEIIALNEIELLEKIREYINGISPNIIRGAAQRYFSIIDCNQALEDWRLIRNGDILEKSLSGRIELLWNYSDTIPKMMGLVAGRPFHLEITNLLCFRFIQESCHDADRDENESLETDETIGPLLKEGLILEREFEREDNSDISQEVLGEPIEDLYRNWRPKPSSAEMRITEISHKLSEILEGRKIRIREGQLKIDRVLGTYNFRSRLVTLYPKMMEIVARDFCVSENTSARIFQPMFGFVKESALRTPLIVFGQIFEVVLIHEFCHAWSHCGIDPKLRDEWKYQAACHNTNTGIHEVIAEYFSWQFLRERRLLASQVHEVLSEKSREEYRIWTLLKNVEPPKVAAALKRWRLGDWDDFLATGLATFLSAHSAQIRLILVGCPTLQRVMSDALDEAKSGADSIERARALGGIWSVLMNQGVMNQDEEFYGMMKVSRKISTEVESSKLVGLLRKWIKKNHPEKKWVFDRGERAVRLAEFASNGSAFTGGLTHMIARRPLPMPTNNPEDLGVIINHLDAIMPKPEENNHERENEDEPVQ